MSYQTFKQYSELVEQQKDNFNKVVDPLIEKFTQNVLANILDQYSTQLQEQQINYILEKIKADLTNAQYNPRKDLRNIISNIYKTGNQQRLTDPTITYGSKA